MAKAKDKDAENPPEPPADIGAEDQAASPPADTGAEDQAASPPADPGAEDQDDPPPANPGALDQDDPPPDPPVETTLLVAMVRAEEFGPPFTAEVHPDEVTNYLAGNWRRAEEEKESA